MKSLVIHDNKGNITGYLWSTDDSVTTEENFVEIENQADFDDLRKNYKVIVNQLGKKSIVKR